MAARNVGKFERDIAQARLDAQAAELRAQGLTYPQLAERLGCSFSTAYARVQRALAAVPVEAVTELRQIECDRIDAVISRLWDIVEAEHPLVSHGKRIEGLLDDGPRLAALAGILRASAEKRKLLGLDAPARQTITVVTEDVVDRAIRELEADLAALDPAGADSC
jgi:transcriptional regulator with XRE-family HTH domain